MSEFSVTTDRDGGRSFGGKMHYLYTLNL